MIYTQNMLLKKITKLQKEIELKQTIINHNEAKISVYKEMIDEIKSRKKELNEEDMIRIARDVILLDREMQRIRKVVFTLKNQGFDVNGNILAKKLLKTKRFRINKDTKYWEYIDDIEYQNSNY
jgi:hypothetical protein